MPVNSDPIPTIVPGSTSVGDAVTSANQVIDRVTSIVELLNTLESHVGNVAVLDTTVKTDLVSAVNEIVERLNNGFLVEDLVGDIANLTTTNKSNTVAAINEILDYVGDLDGLDTAIKTDLVAAINEIKNSTADIGNPAELVTDNKSSIIGAINEIAENLGNFLNFNDQTAENVVAALNSIIADIGDLDTLSTDENASLVAAVNEVKTATATAWKIDGSNVPTADISMGGKKLTNGAKGTVSSDFITYEQVLEIAKVGDLTGLSTTTKTDLVSAINETFAKIGNLSALATTDKSSLVASLNEVRSLAASKIGDTNPTINGTISLLGDRVKMVPTSVVNDSWNLLLSGSSLILGTRNRDTDALVANPIEITSAGNIISTNATIGNLATTLGAINSSLSGKQAALGFTPVQQGGGSGQGANKVYIGWDGSNNRVKVQIDSTDQGYFWTSGLATVDHGGVGYIKLPSGTILQWGWHSGINNQISFPTTFPTYCASVNVTPSNGNVLYVWSGWALDVNQSNFKIRAAWVEVSSGTITTGVANVFDARWFAIGY